MNDIDFLIRCDSLLSLLVHRHGKYLSDIGEKKEAEELQTYARCWCGQIKEEIDNEDAEQSVVETYMKSVKSFIQARKKKITL